MVCKGVCTKYKAKWTMQQFRYTNGQKRCNICEIFVTWDGRHCPCCGMLLRTRPRISRYRQQCIIETAKIRELSK